MVRPKTRNILGRIKSSERIIKTNHVISSKYGRTQGKNLSFVNSYCLFSDIKNGHKHKEDFDFCLESSLVSPLQAYIYVFSP